jgi:hypothetical protein
LVSGNVGLDDALARSSALPGPVTSEVYAGRLALGLLGGLGVLVIYAMGWVAAQLGFITTSSGWALVPFGIMFLIWIAVCTATSSIYHGALYLYAAEGQVPDQFDAQALSSFFRE